MKREITLKYLLTTSIATKYIMSDVVAPKQIKLSLGHQENGSDEPCDIPYHLEASVPRTRTAHSGMPSRNYRQSYINYM